MTEEEKRKRDEAERMLMEKYRNTGKSERSIKQREERLRKREERRDSKRQEILRSLNSTEPARS